MFAEIIEPDIQLAPTLTVDVTRDTYAARLRKPLKTRCHVNAVAMDVVAFDDHVTRIDADTERDSPVIRFIGFAIRHALLDSSVGFTVTNGEVTFASVRYGRMNGDNLLFGTDPQGGTASPQLSVGLAGSPIWGNNNGSTVFTPVVDQVPPTGIPEPATLALYGAGLVGLGYMRRRRTA